MYKYFSSFWLNQTKTETLKIKGSSQMEEISGLKDGG